MNKKALDDARARHEMEQEVWAAEIGEVPEIDLHGMPVVEALHDLEAFIHRELMRGTRVIKIIHGRGTGTLRREIHGWLKWQPLVPYFRDSNIPAQIGGVSFAYLEHVTR